VKTGTPEIGEYGMIDPKIMYDNLMNKFSWGNAAYPTVYLDENNRRMFSNFRRLFGNLGKELLAQGDTVKAVEVAHRGLEIVPAYKLPNDFFSIGLAEILIRSGKAEEGDKLMKEIIKYSSDYLSFALALRPELRFGLEYPIGINMQAMIDIYKMGVNLKKDDLVKTVEPELNRYYSGLYSGKN
jgi:hypothetical protein